MGIGNKLVTELRHCSDIRDLAYCTSCNKNFFDNEVQHIDGVEVCPHCKSQEWKYAKGTNLINCNIELSCICLDGVTIGQVKQRILDDILEALKTYSCTDVKIKDSDIAHIPF